MPVTKPVAVVGLGAILPDAPDVGTFWKQISYGRYSITDVPENRWDPAMYYDPDPSAIDKTYSKIGAWVRDFKLDPGKLGIAIPPRVLEQMDEVQQWVIAATHQALTDYGFPKRNLDRARTAVILGNALGGEKQFRTNMRIRLPEFAYALSTLPEFRSLPAATRKALLDGMRDNLQANIPDITEDTMPGELGNVIAGRVANIFNFQGSNFVTDAACASSLAALQAAVEGLNDYQFDAVLTGGADHMMGVEAFVKFCKIGALSPDGSRPYGDGANGFVMGEGTAIFLLKRLEDAERDGDSIYALVRGIGSSSDGKGKGITAPNQAGQEHAILRAWKNAGVCPASVGLIEGHGTSTRVGDVVEVSSLNSIFGQFNLPKGKIALGSVKSNIGHLKSAAGAAGLLKTVLALHNKALPPSLNFTRANPNIDFSQIPFAVNTRFRPWEVEKGEVRRAGVSAFGFGGTNFHVVVDEYIPGVHVVETPVYRGVDFSSAAAAIPVVVPQTDQKLVEREATSAALVKPYQGIYFLSAGTPDELKQRLSAGIEEIKRGVIPSSLIPSPEELTRSERLAIDYKDAPELLKRAERALTGFGAEGNPWQALVAHGVFRGSGMPGKVAFMFPGQGSQYVNMLKDLCQVEPLAADTFAEADRVMLPILGKPLTSYIYVDGDENAVVEAENALRNTEITQPAMLTANVAMLRLMAKFGYQPDMVIGHSLGEYAGLVASGVLSFADALEVVSTRGREMKKVAWDDNGCMAAVSAPIGEVEKIIQAVDGYVVIANINSPLQCVIGGTTQGVDAALAGFSLAGYQGTKIPVSHAFHTKIVAPASGPLRQTIERMDVCPPKMAVIANVTGDVYPQSRDEIIDLLARQVASPVQFIRGVETLHQLGARVFVEIGPKRVLNALATDILKGKSGVTILATNHPREGAVVSFNKALCGLFAAGVVPYILPKASEDVSRSEPGSQSGVDETAIKQFVLRLVSEKTGYPVEMLDMQLDLEADLGIDTVKQAELFAAIRAHFDIPRRDDLRLADYNTLEKVVGFVSESLAQGMGSVEKTVAETPILKTQASEEIKAFVLQAVSEKTGYPVEMLDLELDLEADLGVDTVKQAELFAVIRTHYDIARRDDLRLSDYNTLTKVINFMESALEEKAVGGSPLGDEKPALELHPTEGKSIGLDEEVKGFVLQAVSEKTGYPVEMLDLDLDLEADLGIDTVKQAELFAVTRTHYQIERRDDLRLADYNTLNKVIGFMETALADQKKAVTEGQAGEAVGTLEGKLSDTIRQMVTGENQVEPHQDQNARPPIPRRVPVAVLLPRTDLTLPTGVVINHESRIVVVSECGKVGSSLSRKLRGLKAQVLMVDGSHPLDIEKQVREFHEGGKVQGVYFLTALDLEPTLAEMTVDVWKYEIQLRADTLFKLVKSLDGEPFLVCATRMGGLLGLDSHGVCAPMGGVVSGFAKAIARERPQCLVKVVDFERDTDSGSITKQLLAETLNDPTVVEVGWKDGLRFSSSLKEQLPGEQNFDLTKNTVFVVSGGSGGITAPVILDLAREVGGRYYLLSRTPLPDAADPDLLAIQADRKAYKLQTAQMLREMGEKATPAAVDMKLASLERGAATLNMMAAAECFGAHVEYLVCDVTDQAACAKVIHKIIEEAGQIDVFIHAAGVERSRKLEAKPVEEFRQTVSVKADGFFHLFKAMEKEKRLPKAVIFFSSLAGRFGNSGQTDYAAANDLLCKLAQSLPNLYPGIKSVALDWGAWAEVGMASRGYVPELMKRAGIDMLQPEEAAPLVRRELIFGPTKGEVVLAGSLGPLVPAEAEHGFTKINQIFKKEQPANRLLDHVSAYSLNEGASFEAELDPTKEPYLFDHALNSNPILPGVIGLEGMARSALFMAGGMAADKGSYRVSEFSDIQFLAPVKFYRNLPHAVIWKTRVIADQETLFADASVETILKRYGREPEPLLNFTAMTHLKKAETIIQPSRAELPRWRDEGALAAAEIYKLFFHGSSFQVIEAVQSDDLSIIGKFNLNLPPISARKLEFLIPASLIELCFQTAGVWEIGKTGILGLPRSISSLKLHQPAVPGLAIYAVVKPSEPEDGQLRFDARVVDADGRVILEMTDYRTGQLPYSVESDLLAPLQNWMKNIRE